MRTAGLQQTWQQLASVYSADHQLVEALWKELEQAYNGKSRHYHTLQHIGHMVSLAQEWQQRIEQPDLLSFAIFYHDVVYKASRSDNEERSAELAVQRLADLKLAHEQIVLVQEMILATKAHQQHIRPDINLLLDLDLSILGTDWPTYEQYCQQIRKEYRRYPDLLYKPGRKKVLLHFLNQPYIYKTTFFRNEWEVQARQNLRRELEKLS